MLRKIGLISLCLTLLLLSACSTVSQNSGRDGPPLGNIDLSKIHDAVPREIAYSRTGNSTYVVYGKRYYVRKTSLGYRARGVASWYGTKFHGHRTSSGERYNLLAMTGAMRDLPIPSFVQVTNLNNHRKVIVEVNDRGPFRENRLIDLSYAAAAKLGVVAHGTAYVEVKAIDPRNWRGEEEARSPAEPKLTVPTHYATRYARRSSGRQQLFLQVGAFAARGSAENILHRIHRVTGEPVRIARDSVAGHSLYRVQVGPLARMDNPDVINQRLVRSGFSRPITVIQ